jgi:hypothetical protein
VVRAKKSAWSATFIDFPPITIHGGRKLKTLGDCREYILALPPQDQDTALWQNAAGALLKAAEHGGPFIMIARLAVSRALHGIEGVEPPPPTQAKNQDRWKERRKTR